VRSNEARVTQVQRLHGRRRPEEDRGIRTVTAQLTLSEKAVARLLGRSGASTDFILSSLDGGLSVKVGLRLASVPMAEVPLGVAGVTVNWSLGVLRRGSSSVVLTRMELRLLAALYERSPEVASREDLSAQLWPHVRAAVRDGDTRVHVLVFSLRKRLRQIGADGVVHTVRNVGYALR
jgi:DNA-binding winged helix-turn-helix (wHTH) protein